MYQDKEKGEEAVLGPETEEMEAEWRTWGAGEGQWMERAGRS